MKLLAHLLAADVRRFRAAILLWIVIDAAQMLVRAWLPELDVVPQQARVMGLARTLLTFADVLVALSLIASVVQTHSLVGSDAFWMTRPIRWDALLASKLVLLLGVIVGFHVAGEIVHMSLYHVPVAYILEGALQTALLLTLGVLAVMAIAAMTPNVARFALVCGAALVAAALVVMIPRAVIEDSFLRYGIRVYEPGTALLSIARERDFVRFVAAGVAALIAALVAVGVQYRWRAWQWSAGAAVAGVVLVLLLGSFRSWPAPAAWVIVPKWAEAPGAARLEGDAGSLYFKPLQYGRENTDWQLGRVRFGVASVPDGWIATARLASASLEYPGGRISGPGYVTDRVLPFTDRNTDRGSVPATLKQVLGVQRYAASTTASVGWPGDSVAFVARTSETSRAAAAGPGTYRGEFVLTLTHMAVAGVLPLVTGATFAEDGYQFFVERIEHDDDNVKIFGRTSVVRTIFYRAPQPSYLFILRNRRLSQAIEADAYRNRVVLRPMFPISSAFYVSTSEIDVNRAGRRREAVEPVFDAAWLKDAELVVVRTVAGGMVSRILELQTLTIAGEERAIRPAIHP